MKKSLALLACAVMIPMSLPSGAQVRFIPTPEPAPFSLAVAVDGILYVSGEIGIGAGRQARRGLRGTSPADDGQHRQDAQGRAADNG